MFTTIAMALHQAINIYTFIIIIRAVLSFFPQMDRGHPLVRFLDQIVDPVLRPFQRLLPPMGGLDLSPLLAIVTLRVVGDVIVMLVASLGR